MSFVDSKASPKTALRLLFQYWRLRKRKKKKIENCPEGGAREIPQVH